MYYPLSLFLTILQFIIIINIITQHVRHWNFAQLKKKKKKNVCPLPPPPSRQGKTCCTHPHPPFKGWKLFASPISMAET